MKKKCTWISQYILIILSISILPSCSVFSPVKSDHMNTYVLSATPHYYNKKSKRYDTLLVMPTEASSLYKTSDMAYTTRPYQIAYFAKNRWAETPAKMLNPLIVQALQRSHLFHAIVTQPYAGHYDVALKTQILQMEQNFKCHPSIYQLAIRAQLTSANSGKVIATKEFSISERAPCNTPYSGVVAANVTVDRFLEELVEFCERTN